MKEAWSVQRSKWFWQLPSSLASLQEEVAHGCCSQDPLHFHVRHILPLLIKDCCQLWRFISTQKVFHHCVFSDQVLNYVWQLYSDVIWLSLSSQSSCCQDFQSVLFSLCFSDISVFSQSSAPLTQNVNVAAPRNMIWAVINGGNNQNLLNGFKNCTIHSYMTEVTSQAAEGTQFLVQEIINLLSLQNSNELSVGNLSVLPLRLIMDIYKRYLLYHPVKSWLRCL